ncbi:MAG: hypothetical protein SVX43_09010 [Cyanobacteriota bacterium]|nr:hypothetical protein [Cyanobacteriota bacterium]
MSSTLVDCDTDGETLVLFGMCAIWLTTASIGDLSISAKFWRNCQALWFINAICAIFSLASLARFFALIQYTKEIQDYCP